MDWFTVSLFNADIGEHETYTVQGENRDDAVEAARECAVSEYQSTDSDEWEAEEVAPAMEGWGWLWNAKKWHYFAEDGRSLCGKWFRFGVNGLDPADVRSEQNCTGCQRKFDQRKEQQ